VPITGDMIQEAASQFWRQIPALACNPKPKFSSGWLDGFKRRHKIKKQKQHGEAGSADLAGSEERMIEMRNIVNEYEMDDMYNMDEAALYWKMVPDVTLATERLPGSKKEKARISIAVCSNASGSHKLRLWVIGKAKNPRCFGRNKTKISSLGMI
jgi:hypothetical protein